MTLQPGADGTKINWINYKTGVKHLFFRMHADKHQAAISIEITHPDAGIQELVFEQFKALGKILEMNLAEEWEWQLHVADEYGKTISRICKPLPGVSIFKQEDWPQLISFFKPRIIALDQFWDDAQYSFEVFR